MQAALVSPPSYRFMPACYQWLQVIKKYGVVVVYKGVGFMTCYADSCQMVHTLKLGYTQHGNSKGYFSFEEGEEKCGLKAPF
jgi:hypothetical protein